MTIALLGSVGVWLALVGQGIGFTHAAVAEQSADLNASLEACRRASDAGGLAVCRDIVHKMQIADDTAWRELDSPILYERLAHAAEELRNPRFALELFRAAARRFPDNARFHDGVGRLLFDTWGAYAEAYGPLLESVRLNPDGMQARLRLAVVQAHMGLYNEALESYRVLVAREADSLEVQTGFGEMLAAVGRFGDAERELRDALQRGDKEETVQRTKLALADALFWLGRADEALRLLRTARNPHAVWDGQVSCGMANLLDVKGDEREGRRACVEGISTWGCSCVAWPTNVSSSEFFDERDTAVAVALLQHNPWLGPSTSFVVRAETGFDLYSAPDSFQHVIGHNVRARAESYGSETLSAIGDLFARNRVSVNVRVSNAVPATRTLERKEARKIFYDTGAPFDRQFPGARGMITLSRPGYNPTGDVAVIYMLQFMRLDEPLGRVFILRKSGNWRVIGFVRVWQGE